MIRNMIILAALIALAGAYTYMDAKQPGEGQEVAAYQENTAIPNFDFKDLSGKTRNLSDIKDKVVIVNFWASWCAPCVVEFPAMVALAKTTGDKAVFLFLSLDDNNDDIDRFLNKHGQSLPPNVIIGQDADKNISKNIFGTYRLPETYILDKNFRVAQKIVGADIDWNGADMRRSIENIFDGKRAIPPR